MRIIGTLFGVALASLLLGCTPAPSPAPVPDAGDAGPVITSGCVRACERLAALDCPEGHEDNCAVTCERVLSVHLIRIDTECLAAARDKAAARACGAVSCGGGGP